MDFSYSPKVVDLQQRLTAFMDEHIYPAEAVYHAEVVAHRVGEPFGTLVLAVAVTVIEVAFGKFHST